jgi:hypothetical protein
MIYSLTLSVDDNGNRKVTVRNGASRGFSVQTNGNLPTTHMMHGKSIDEGVALEELRNYIYNHGTEYQRNYLGC